ncbi:MAG: hypothetical protein BVN28_05975 [Nitrospira sp. ST-bin4]|nr:MAG: hypothetical protein BVN28_05975 [Nitrospira sp. ST-bin4]
MATSPKRPSKTKTAASKKPSLRSKATTSRSSKSTIADAGETYIVFGIVTNADATPAAGLTVIAYDMDESSEDRLGQATTDTRGAYRILYSATDFRQSEKERGGADVIVRVYNDQSELLFTSRKKNNAPAKLELTITLPAVALLVHGMVTDANHKPLAGVIVHAYDRDLRRRQKVGEDTSGADGRYRIAYVPERYASAEKRSADIYIEVRDPDDALLGSSDIVFNAPADLTLDFAVPGNGLQLSELELLLGDVTPLLNIQGPDDQDLAIGDLTEDDELFIKGETGRPAVQVACLIQAAHLARALSGPDTSSITRAAMVSHAASTTASQVPIEALYGWLRQGLPRSLSELLSESADRLRLALDSAIRDNVIPQFSGKELDEIMSNVRALKVRRAVAPSTSGDRASFGDLLGIALPSSRHSAVAQAYVLHAPSFQSTPQDDSLGAVEKSGGMQEFWDALERSESVTADEVVQLKRVAALNELTGGHLPLIRALHEMGKDDPSLADVQGYARLDASGWAAILKAPRDSASEPIGVPSGEESIDTYARTIAQTVQRKFPTAVLADRIARGDAEGGPFASTKADLVTFFSNNPMFTFEGETVDAYLSRDPGEKLKGVKQPVILQHQLNKMQRLSKIAPQLEQQEALLADGLDSSYAVLLLGQEEFRRRFGQFFGGEASAAVAYAAAEDIGLQTLALFHRLGAHANKPLPHVLRGLGASVVDTSSLSQADMATWNSLFGPLDLCNCEECQSLYGAAAYLMDTLLFLKQIPAQEGFNQPLDVLLRRRPDLANLEFTCDNTNTRLPYVDLVNEVLENAVARTKLTIPGNFPAAGFDSLVIPAPIRQVLRLTAKAVLVANVPGRSWAIRDPGWRYVINIGEGNTGVDVSPYPQSSATEQELTANAEHINGAAYAKLARAGYPWTLPFNLPVEEARIYLRQLGVERYELMEAFASPAVVYSDSSIVSERLRLSALDEQIITGAATSTGSGANEPWTFWGFDNAAVSVRDPGNDAANLTGSWDTVLRRVAVFLRQSGLRYADLLDLLESYFLNPVSGATRTLSIVSLDTTDPATCDLKKLQINGLTSAILSKIPRFTRVRRALDWSVFELDRAIRAFNTTDLTALFLRQVAHVRRLSAALNLPVSSLLVFWSSIDKVTYHSPGAGTKQPAALPSVYSQLFRNQAVLSPVDPGFTEDPVNLSGTLRGHASTILGALRISAADFAALMTGSAPVVPDVLSLDNLSALYRHALLAQGLKLSVPELLQAKQLIGVNPFADTETTVRFVERIAAMRTLGFSIGELTYLLQHKSNDSTLLASADDAAAATLSDLREGLRAIDDEQSVALDPQGDVTRKKLAQLNWNATHIERLVATLSNALVSQTALAVFPAGLVFPPSLDDRITYVAGNLCFKGVMSTREQAALKSAAASVGSDLTLYRGAVDALYSNSRTAARTFLEQRARAFTLPSFIAPSASARLAHGVVFPDAWKTRIRYDAATGKIELAGAMLDEEKTALLALSADADYQQAINSLDQQAKNYAPEPRNEFLFSSSDPATDRTRTSFTALFDSDRSVAARFAYVLTKLCGYLRTTSSERFVKQKLSDALTLQPAIVERLVTVVLNAPSDPSRQKAIVDLVDPAFARSHGAITAQYHPYQCALMVRLQKAAALVHKLAITPDQLTYLSGLQTAAEWMDWNAIPSGSSNSAIAFVAWEQLTAAIGLRGAPFTSDDAPFELMAMANDASTARVNFLRAIRDATGWDLADLHALAGPDTGGQGLLGINFPADFSTTRALSRLRGCFRLMQRLGVSATQIAQWRLPNLAPDGPDLSVQWASALANARAVKSAVKAKYDDQQWLSLVKPLKNPLRERQRTALVDYLVAQQYFGNDESDLYDHLLIDVEMGACMMTTRLVQATSSVQLFIQRCLMNLEPEVVLTTGQAKEWNTWRKRYRVWGANREVFLYPENWIEPQLRDDKSPIFKELENELLQGDVTADTSEDAVRHYLEKLDQVARLEVVGLYLQHDPADTSSAGDILHLFGRTYTNPHLYFYRRREGGVWTAWEKVDLDVEGDHLIPVVWNRHLYLFWALFTEKTDQQTKEERTSSTEPKKYWEIKLAWSEYKNNRWLPKKVSGTLLRQEKDPSPAVPQEREDFTFTAAIQTGAFGTRLAITCYGTVVTGESTVTTSSQPVKRTHLMDLPARISAGGRNYGTECRFRFTLQGRNLTDAEAATIQIDIGSLPHSLTRSATETTFKHTNSFISPVPCDLVSRSYAVETNGITINDGWGTTHNNVAYVSNKTIDVRLEALPSTVVTTTVDPAYVRMQAVGRFLSNDCHADLVALEAREVSPPIQPLVLQPMAGTRIVNMQWVEHGNPLDTFGSTTVMLNQTPGRFRVTVKPDGFAPRNLSCPFVFQDEQRTYLAVLERVVGGQIAGGQKLRFEILFHPRVCPFLETIDASGLPGLFDLATQSVTDTPSKFQSAYGLGPGSSYVDLDVASDPTRRTPREDVDFSSTGAYSLYNWELFFHVPFLIALKLSENQRFEEALTWFHYIFDPTSSETGGRERFWRFKPFFDEASLAPETLSDFLHALSTAYATQLSAWQKHPFQPYVIARLRPIAFMKTVVMKYIDTLIAWGDQLFRQDTMESVNEATQLYLLAAKILGKRPEEIPSRAVPVVQTFDTLAVNPTGALLGPLVDIENYLFPSTAPGGSSSSTGAGSLGTMALFCLPKNDMLLGYWDTVADRLFKIRNCMNIEGVARELAIFAPRIDPGLLVRAAAAGVDLNSVLSDLYAPLPSYRFGVMQQKAAELCNDVKALGSALLSALEKRDSEALALLRSSHEVQLLNAIRVIKQNQADEARTALDGLNEGRKVTEIRHNHYKNILQFNPWEIAQLALSSGSLVAQALELIPLFAAAPGHAAAVTASTGTVGILPVAVATKNTGDVATGMETFGKAMGVAAAMLGTGASIAGTTAGYQRRWDEWKLQEALAEQELKQIDKQIAAAEIRLAISETELINHDLQIKHAKDVDSYMRSKYTNQELYDWMIGQVSAVYFQSYQLAYDVAKRAERCYRFELGLTDSHFIQFGYWDSLKKGLLAGERLQLDLRRMEIDYLDRNRREYEITKSVSLLLQDPVALIRLKETGQCEVELPETLFDMDYPGHYLRRIKNVSLTIPCVVGPYTSINCTLTLLSNKIRVKNTQPASYEERAGDTRFASNFGALQSIATSHAQNDSGMFELNFRDERYLPFEGMGAISRWRIDMPIENNAFDLDTISDVVMQVRYTARDGGGALATAAADALYALLTDAQRTPLVRAFSLKNEFPSEWSQFLNSTILTAASDATHAGIDQRLRFDLSNRFPFQHRTSSIAIQSAQLYLKLKQDLVGHYDNAHPLVLDLARVTGNTTVALGSDVTLVMDGSPLSDLPSATAFGAQAQSPGLWEIRVTETRKDSQGVDQHMGTGSLPQALRETIAVDGVNHRRLKPDAVRDILVVCVYSLSAPQA